jgi:Aspartyl protease
MRRNRFGLIFVLAGLGVAASGPTRSVPQIGAQDQSHTLKLTSFAIPPGAPLGLLLKVRIDNGPVLRLLLDSGAQFIVLDKNAAAKSGYAGGSELDLVGMGRLPKAARMAKAGTVTVGDLVFHDCTLIVAGGKVLDGVDGVIPLSLFAGFLVHLDLPGKTLDLRPYSPPGSVDDGHLSPVRAHNDLLFIKGVLNDSREGYVLLDTGASFNVISESTARALKYPPLFASSVRLQSGAGAIEGSMYPTEVRFRFGSQVVPANPVMVVGLQHFEQYNQIEVAGILGYPALRESILTINYRDGLVGIDRK